MDVKVRFIVDEERVNRAIGELYAILLHQENAFRERWYGSPRIQTVQKILRMAGMVLSLIGLALSVVLLVDSRRRTAPMFASIPLFAGFMAIFYFVPRLLVTARAWSARRSDARCRGRARRLFRASSRLAPYEAEYDVKGDLIVYSRGKNGEWKYAWHRKLDKFRVRGLALQASSLTAIFRRSTSFLPSIILLHDATRWPSAVLAEVGVPTTIIGAPNAPIE